jgi:(p)ppGpp synthase/HD superfamily hydrolase
VAIYSQAFDTALIIAAIVHQCARRKGTRIPYIMHPVHVSALVARSGASEDVAVAAVLHDVLEDFDASDAAVRDDLRKTFTSLAGLDNEPEHFREGFDRFLRRTFSARVMQLVDALTERKTEGGRARPWRARKEESLAHLRHGDDEAVLLKGADVLHNVRSIVQDLSLGRAGIKGRFTATPGETLWYYEAVHEIVHARLPAAPIDRELAEALGALRTLVEQQVSIEER